uniref:F5/8 type C domain-containing protein n=1 Tax=Macrostomum lignano TaxID=282301 RepID=A0A1I8JS60_9PLAT
MNLRRHTHHSQPADLSVLQRVGDSGPSRGLQGPLQSTTLPVMFDHRVYLYYNNILQVSSIGWPFRYLKWEPCLLFDTMFRCPLVNIDGAPELFTTVFEIALPKNCYESQQNDPLGTARHHDNLWRDGKLSASGVNKPGHQQSADVQQEFALLVSQHALCTHQTTAFTHCPPFEAESLLDPNSYFNNVVDEDFQWIIFDIGSHKHISLLKLFINRMDLSAMRFLEVFVRGAPLPHWLVETDFRSGSKRREGTANRILQEGHHGRKKCSGALRGSQISSRPHQRTRWVMIRMKVNSDLLEMKYMMGFDWLKFPEISRILVTNLEVFETPLDMMNCLTMHHPPMGPENADYWEDLYSFDGSGQPQEPPVFTQTHPQFTLPLNTHDSVHPDERFLQEDWDVEACGDWEIMKDTTIVGVPSKLKLTISQEHPRGQSCYEWKEALGPIKDSSCKRAVYFRVDNDTGEVIHYPDFGRSYGLAVDMQNWPLQSEHDVRAYESGTVYGRKSDTMTTSNPFTWNNPYHPYYRMLQDLLEETGFFPICGADCALFVALFVTLIVALFVALFVTLFAALFVAAVCGTACSAVCGAVCVELLAALSPSRKSDNKAAFCSARAQTRAPLPAAFRTTSPLFLRGSSAAKSKPRNAAQKQRQQVGPSQVSDPQPAAPAAAPQAVTSSAAEELQLLWASALGPLQPGGLLLPTTGLALLDQLLIQHHQHHQVLQLLQSQHQSGFFRAGTTGNPLAYDSGLPTDEGVLAAAAAAASTEPSAPAADEPKDSAVKLVDEDANGSAGPHSAGSDGGEDATGKYRRKFSQCGSAARASSVQHRSVTQSAHPHSDTRAYPCEYLRQEIPPGSRTCMKKHTYIHST